MAALVALILGAVAGMTTVSAATFTCDALAIARADVHASGVADAESAELRGSWDGSAPPSVGARGTSTTAPLSVVATEAGSVRNVNPLGGTANCVNCAVATDATLSGGPSSALNVRPGVTGQPISVLEDIYGGAFKSVSGQAQIEQMLLDGGPGSRGIVFGSRGADVPGHVFNAVNQNGVIRFLDGQTGGVASFKGYSGFEFLVTG